jgi:hypothetical protein
MEWYGEKMLPRGLPELVYQVTPYKILANLKLIVHNRQITPYISGSANPKTKVIRLYPTVMFDTLNILINWDGVSVLSFRCWLLCLETVLHEIGHIVMHPKYEHITEYTYSNMPRQRKYVERLANEWRDDMIYKIKRRHVRVGQPEGLIGGLAEKFILPLGGRMQMRAYQCGGQLIMKDVAKMVNSDKHGEISRMMRLVKRKALNLRHKRHYIDAAGRKHLVFNYGEAVEVAKRVLEVIRKKSGGSASKGGKETRPPKCS